MWRGREEGGVAGKEKENCHKVLSVMVGEGPEGEGGEERVWEADRVRDVFLCDASPPPAADSQLNTRATCER